MAVPPIPNGQFNSAAANDQGSANGPAMGQVQGLAQGQALFGGNPAVRSAGNVPPGGPANAAVSPSGKGAMGVQPKSKPSMPEVGIPIEYILEHLTTMLRQQVSHDVIKAGLPLVNGLVSPRAVERAIKQSGLKSQTEKAIKGRKVATTPFLIPLPNGRFALGVRWNVDGSLDVMGLEMPEEGGKPSVKTFPPKAVPAFLPEKVISLRRSGSLKKQASATDGKLTGLAQFENWFWPVFRSQWQGYMYACLATLLINVMIIFSSFYAMQVYDRVIPTMAIDTLWVLTVGVMIVHLFTFIIKNLQSYFLDGVGRRIDLRMSSEIFSRVMSIKSKNRPKNSGAFAHTFNSFETVREFLSSVTTSSLVEIPFSILFILAMFVIAGPLGYIPLVLGPGMMAISFALQIWVDRSVKNEMRAGADKNAILLESLSGIESIKCLAAESSFQQKWEDAVEIAADSNRMTRLVATLSQSITLLVQSVGTVLVMVFGVIMMQNQSLSQGAIFACSFLVSRSLSPYIRLTTLMARLRQVRMSLSVVQKLSEQQGEWSREEGFIDQPVAEGSIIFHKVTFSYPDTSTPVLQEINFAIQAGERVGIIGASGSGKSTLSKMILGLYEGDTGAVQVGGIDNRQYNPRTLRRSIAYAPQDPFIFNGTLLDNIRYGNDQASNEEILNSGKLAGVDLFASQHPDGIMMQTGELGRNLSGGQRQMLSLARTYIKRSKILILDEPSNSLDGNSEALLQQYLANFPKDRTLILITHRQPLLQMVDRLIMMDRGRVVLDGTRDEVMNRLGGRMTLPGGPASGGIPTPRPAGAGGGMPQIPVKPPVIGQPPSVNQPLSAGQGMVRPAGVGQNIPIPVPGLQPLPQPSPLTNVNNPQNIVLRE